MDFKNLLANSIYIHAQKRCTWEKFVHEITSRFFGDVSMTPQKTASNKDLHGICDERFPAENRVLFVGEKFIRNSVEVLSKVGGIVILEDNEEALNYIKKHDLVHCVVVNKKNFTKSRIWSMEYFNDEVMSETFFLSPTQHPSAEEYKACARSFYLNLEQEKKNHPSTEPANNFAMGLDATVGKNVLCGKHVNIASTVKLMGNNFIGDYSVLEEGVVLHPGVVLGAGTYVGRGTVIHAGTVVGSDGFGYELLEEDDVAQLVKVPQLGRVIIGNDVEIGANVAIDKATLSATIIGSNVKIDNLVQIAHNVEIGDGCIIVSQVGIAGSTTLGKGVTLAGQVGIADHCTIGNGVKIGAQSGVTSHKKIAAGSVLFGSPAIDFRTRMRMESALRGLIIKPKK